MFMVEMYQSAYSTNTMLQLCLLFHSGPHLVVDLKPEIYWWRK